MYMVTNNRTTHWASAGAGQALAVQHLRDTWPECYWYHDKDPRKQWERGSRHPLRATAGHLEKCAAAWRQREQGLKVDCRLLAVLEVGSLLWGSWAGGVGAQRCRQRRQPSRQGAQRRMRPAAPGGASPHVG